MRSRLLALIAVPTLIAVIFGGVRLASSARSALGDQRVLTLANLGGKITVLAQALEDERDTTAWYIAQGRPAGSAQAVQQAEARSSQSAEPVTLAARKIGRGYPAEARTQAAAVINGIGGLTAVRTAALNSNAQPLTVVQDYSGAIDDLLALDDDIAQGSGDSALAGTVRTLGLVSRMKEEASQQRGILNAALTRGQFLPGELGALEAAQAQQASNLAVFNTSATAAQRELYRGTVTGALVTRAGNQEQNAISLASRAVGGGGSLRGGGTTAGGWNWAMSNVINRMRAVETNVTGAAISRSATLRKDAITSAAVGSGAVVLVLLISVGLTALIARSMVGPLRRLRAGALDIAGIRLPETVRRLGESEDGDLPSDVPSEVDAVDLDSADEIGEVARAFDQVHREAVRLAANEALLRDNVNDMFVNLSRRTQSLVERQLDVIDDLEQSETDSARLETLFRMDHLATRMRRNSDNLLVLAGHEGGRRWKQPVSVLNVLRAAVSEIEQYARVHIDAMSGPAVRGPAVGDVVHLVAELVENATAFSPAETPVSLTSRMQSGGRVLLEISDQGIGMGAEDIAQANSRLDNPPVVDVEVSRRMGLFVVGRLAARHGIKVRLGPSPEGGLAAVIWMPDELVVDDPESSTSGQFAAVPPLESTSGQFPAVDPVGSTSGQFPAVEPVGSTSGQFPAVEPVGSTSGQFPAVDPVGSTSGQFAAVDPVGSTSGQFPAVPPVGSQSGEFPAVPPVRSPSGPFVTVRPVDSPSGQFPAVDPAGVPDLALTVPTPFAPPLPAHEKIGPASAPAGTENDPVIVPAGRDEGRSRLPIFESVGSAWFGGGSASASTGHLPAGIDPNAGLGRTGARDEGHWTSPGDEGWEAADTAHAPVAGGTTAAGLPKRVPQANLVPGNAGRPEGGGSGDGRHRTGMPDQAAPGTVRSAQEIRERLSSFQRGASAGRAAGEGGQADADEDEWEGNE